MNKKILLSILITVQAQELLPISGNSIAQQKIEALRSSMHQHTNQMGTSLPTLAMAGGCLCLLAAAAHTKNMVLGGVGAVTGFGFMLSVSRDADKDAHILNTNEKLAQKIIEVREESQEL